MFVKLWLVAAIFNPKINDFFCRFCICKVERWSRVEFDILCRDAFTGRKEFTMDVKNLVSRHLEDSVEASEFTHLHSEASGLRNAILMLVSA